MKLGVRLVVLPPSVAHWVGSCQLDANQHQRFFQPRRKAQSLLASPFNGHWAADGQSQSRRQSAGRTTGDPSEHLTVRGSFKLTFIKSPMEGSLGRLRPAAVFITVQSLGTTKGCLWGYLVLAYLEEGWHDKEALVPVEGSHLNSCRSPALLFY